MRENKNTNADCRQHRCFGRYGVITRFKTACGSAMSGGGSTRRSQGLGDRGVGQTTGGSRKIGEPALLVSPPCNIGASPPSWRLPLNLSPPLLQAPLLCIVGHVMSSDVVLRNARQV